MKSWNKVTIAISLLLLIAVTAMASQYQFGTKVLATDDDIGKPLFAMPPGTDILFWDTGVLPGYDDSDVVYLVAFPAPPNVKANDVRLTPFGGLPAGSKVTPADNDIGMPLSAFPIGHGIRYLDLYGSMNYDLADPVYFTKNAVITTVNDVRLNTTPGTGLFPGTKMFDFQPDLNKVLAGPALVTLPKGPGPALSFFDVNGNAAYDFWDDVYMNSPSGFPAGTVTTNNVRLSGPVV
jgi:hypothetical protein